MAGFFEEYAEDAEVTQRTQRMQRVAGVECGVPREEHVRLLGALSAISAVSGCMVTDSVLTTRGSEEAAMDSPDASAQACTEPSSLRSLRGLCVLFR